MSLFSLEKKVVRKTSEAVAPDLHRGETVDLVSLGGVGEFAPVVSENVALGTVSVLLSALSIAFGAGGAATFALRERLFVVLTSERLLFLRRKDGTAQPVAGVVLEMPRAAITAEPRPTKLAGRRVAILAREDPSVLLVTLDFHFAIRDDAKALVAALA